MTEADPEPTTRVQIIFQTATVAAIPAHIPQVLINEVLEFRLVKTKSDDVSILDHLSKNQDARHGNKYQGIPRATEWRCMNQAQDAQVYHIIVKEFCAGFKWILGWILGWIQCGFWAGF